MRYWMLEALVFKFNRLEGKLLKLLWYFSVINVITVAMNVADLIKMNVYHAIIIMMSTIFNKAHMNVLMNVRSIIIQIQQLKLLWYFSVINVITVAMNVADLIKMNVYHAIIIMMSTILKKVLMSALLNVRSISIQIQQIGR